MNEELVISGMSGRFPESDGVDELRDNLFSGKDMITEDNRRWPLDLYGMPNRLGKIKDCTRFDAEFFGIHNKLAHNMDPMMRLLLEITYETVVDAGYNPDELRGRDVGVYICGTFSDFNEAVHSEVDAINGSTTIGTLRNMVANRISYAFDWHGPSLSIDTACSSSLQALYMAYSDLRLGKVEMAIVGAPNLTLLPAISLKFHKHKMLSKVGKCQFLDAAADGYVRAETIAAVMLERRTTAKRIYGTLVNINSNNDGYKVEGISYPSSRAQIAVMKKTLIEANVKPENVAYIECHGTGTQAGDQNEAYAVHEVYCQNRGEPLLVGSIKTNLGHSEGSSGLCSVIKVLIAFQNNSIPANLHFSQPNKNISALMQGKIKPIIKNKEFVGDDIVAINSFGMGGTNVHLLIKPEPLRRDNEQVIGGIPRLITVNGRTEYGVENLLDFIDQNADKVSNDFLSLLDELKAGPKGPASRAMNYHGYMLYDWGLKGQTHRDIQECNSDKREVWLVLSGMGSQWKNMIEQLMDLPIFADSIHKCADYLKPYGLDLIDLLTVDEKQLFESFVGTCVGIAAVQIALIDILRALGIHWDGLIGHSAGEMTCAYADGLMDAQQIMLAKYQFARCFEGDLPLGQMGAIGLTWQESEQKCPANVYPACHNSDNSVTISGLHSETNEFMAKLKEEKVFAKEVNSCGISFHCPVLLPLKDVMVEKLKPFIPKLKRSDKWLSSSWPTHQWTEEGAQYSSAEYYAQNAVVPVLFDQCIKMIPKNAIVIEVAPDSLFRNILRKTVGDEMSYVGLMKRNNGANNLSHLLCSIGQLHNFGLNPKVQNIYPKAMLPVRRGTQSISSLVKWDHSEQWFVPLYPKYFNSKGLVNNQINNNSNEIQNQPKISGIGFEVELPAQDQANQNESKYLTKINQILGIKNSAKVKRDKKLHEWGMDSLMSVEIKEVIDQEIGQDISLETLPNLTYGYLIDLSKLA